MNYKKELIKVLVFAAVGAVIGYIIGTGIEVEADRLALIAYYGAGVPCGWRLVGKIINFNMIGLTVSAVIFMLIKLVLAAVTGMFALPILIIYYIVKIVRK